MSGSPRSTSRTLLFTGVLPPGALRWGGALLLVTMLFTVSAAAGELYCPKSPFYPHHNYPSVLDAPRGYGPVPVYGFAGPSYRWGWFGAQYRPRVVHYTGYTGDYWETGYRWGY